MKQIVSLMTAILITTTSIGQVNQVPANYKLKEENYGDLDKDGISEKVVVYDIITPENENNGIDREIIIYKKQKESWKIWHRSKNAVKNSTEGGAFGDPFFEGIEISKGVLLIYHYGGSNYRWSHTDKYRFQNNRFELIGYTDHSGRPCDEWLGFDFNVTTGKIVVTNEFEKCDDAEKNDIKHVVYKKKNETFTHKLSETLTLENRYKNSETNPIIITSPKYKHELYLKF
jgi:hypothetical protein